MNMKTVLKWAAGTALLTVVILLGVMPGPATVFPMGNIPHSVSNTFVNVSATYTNSTGTNNVEECTYHTLIVSGAATNTNSVTITLNLWRTLDGAVLIPFYTNTFLTAQTNEIQMTGKWKYIVWKLTATNTQVKCDYLGQ